MTRFTQNGRSRKVRTAMLAAFFLAGCNGTNIIGPANQLQVSAPADNFQFQASNLDNVTQNLSYAWVNNGNQATIDISSAITAGTAVLTVTDDAGTVVYEDDLGNDNDADSTVGIAGNWTVALRLNGVRGTLNFRVQRKT